MSNDMLAYMVAGYMPQISCLLSVAFEWVKQEYPIFEITFHDDQFFADGIPTDYFWEDDTLFRRIKK